MTETTRTTLLEKYDTFLIDAYGVLVTSKTVLPGAVEFLDLLRKNKRDYLVLTNDASRSPSTVQNFLRSRGLDLPLDRIHTAGLAIEPAVAALKNPRCFVFGTDETLEHVKNAGGQILEFNEADDCDAVVIGDDSGFDFLPAVNSVLTTVHRMLLAGRPLPKLLLANADVIYPLDHQTFHFASGAIANLLLDGWRTLHPQLSFEFEVLGKPSPGFFTSALKRLGTAASHRVVMLGDQLRTDVAGANASGIDSALLFTGVTRAPLPKDLRPEWRPTWVLKDLN